MRIILALFLTSLLAACGGEPAGPTETSSTETGPTEVVATKVGVVEYYEISKR